MFNDAATATGIGFLLAGLAAWAVLGGERDRTIPDRDLTPGLVATADRAEICAHPEVPGSWYSRQHRAGSEEERRADFDRYGVAWSDRRHWEVDHLVPLCLGGADAPANRWVQPRFGPWTAEMKDRLEGWVCRAVCLPAGAVNEVPYAQTRFLRDWREYHQEVFR